MAKKLDLKKVNIQLDVAKINHQEMADQLLSSYTDGWCTIEDIYAKITHLQKVLEIAESTIKDKMIESVQSNKSIDSLGINFTFKNGSKIAKFDNVPYIQDLERKLKNAKEISKSLANTGQKEMADTDTGEIINACYFEYQKDSITKKFN